MKVNVKAMMPDERREYLREIGRRGGKARAQFFTPASQRRARAKLSPEKAAENGRKGAAKTIQVHGYQALFEGSRRKRLLFPSPCELVMMGLLKTLRLEYE